MDQNENQVHSSVSQFFEGKTIFLTGATGYVGRFLIYKMLKELNVAKIFICLRGKRNRTVQQRFQEFKDLELFTFLPKEALLDKLVVVEGDVCHENLGLCPEDLSRILKEVNIMYHSAATIRFTEPLKTASRIHILGTHHVTQMCRQMQNLQLFVHVSSISVWSVHPSLKEKVPEAPFDPMDFANQIESLPKSAVDKIEASLIGSAKEGKWLNTYALTKSLAENVVVRSGLEKVVIIRPPFLTSPMKEPKIGWFDEPQTGAGLTALFSLGILRIAELKDVPLEVVPIDMCVNTFLTTAYYHSVKNKDQLLVVNMSSSSHPDSSVTTIELLQQGITLGYKYPSVKQIRPPIVMYSSLPSKTYIRVHDFISHTLFSLLIDLILFISGSRPKLYSLTRKNANAVMHIFSLCLNYKDQWNQVQTDQLEDIHSDKVLSKEDQQVFFYDLSQIPWRQLAAENHLRFRRHVLKEPDSNLEFARHRLQVVCVGYRLFKAFVWTSFALFVYYGHLTLLSTPLLWLPFMASVSFICGVYLFQ